MQSIVRRKMRKHTHVSISAKKRNVSLDGSSEDLIEVQSRVRRLSVLSCDEIAVEDAGRTNSSVRI